MNYLFKSHLTEIEVLCENYQVLSLYAIGQACNNELSGGEVLDLLIDFNGLSKEKEIEQTFRMTYLLEKVLQCRVELIRRKESKYPGILNKENPSKLLLYKK